MKEFVPSEKTQLMGYLLAIVEGEIGIDEAADAILSKLESRERKAWDNALFKVEFINERPSFEDYKNSEDYSK